ncbi:MAG TPA: glycosyltransferase family 4 protein [Terriglobia bacterium]|nr:glycosyltransferase family 4 protein [Terriglobia bacterium]
MNIAIFDYGINDANPTGKCSLRVAEALASVANVTVFSSWFSNPREARIRWVKVPTLNRPQALLFVGYHLMAPILYFADRARRRSRFDHVQMVESNLSFGDVCYSHFCHRAYLKHWWKQSPPIGIRRISSWLNHRFHSLAEPWVYQRAKWIVVPSRGLARELVSEYPKARGKIHVISNPVDVEMCPPKGFDRSESRSSLGFLPEDIVMVFVATGAFERKGLPLLLEAMPQVRHPRLRLLVVGGAHDLVAKYRLRAAQTGLGKQVVFVGFQRFVCHYLWAADAFVFPSFYETFSLVSFEAAAAGLPLLVSQLHGVEEFLRDGENAILLERTPEGVAEGIRKFLAMSPQARHEMGERARLDVQRYSIGNFMAAWRSFYEKLNAA